MPSVADWLKGLRWSCIRGIRLRPESHRTVSTGGAVHKGASPQETTGTEGSHLVRA